jgi:hypothetical protein
MKHVFKSWVFIVGLSNKILQKKCALIFFSRHTVHADSAQLSKIAGMLKLYIQCMDLSLWDDLGVYINIFMTNLIKKWLAISV